MKELDEEQDELKKIREEPEKIDTMKLREKLVKKN